MHNARQSKTSIFPQRSEKHPNSHWRWWQALAASFIGLGIFGVVIGLVPPFSFDGLKFGLLLAVIGTLAGIWNWWNYDWWARLIMGGVWTLMIAAITARAWTSILPASRIWQVSLLFAFFLGWLLPAISPSLSKFLWQEQSTPQTRIGRGVLAICISIAPVAGAIGASIGMFGSRFGDSEVALLVGAGLGTVGTVIIPFAISYQLWPGRPWAKRKIVERQK
jgi:hypothetical protein